MGRHDCAQTREMGGGQSLPTELPGNRFDRRGVRLLRRHVCQSATMDLPDWSRMGLSIHIGASPYVGAERGVRSDVRLVGAQAARVGNVGV